MGAFSSSKSEPKWCPEVPKSSPGAPDGTVGVTPATADYLTIPNTRLRERQGAPGLHFGSILAPILESFWVCFWELKSITFLVCFCMPFGVDLGAFWEPKLRTLGAWRGTGSEKAILQKPLFYLQKTMFFEVRRPRGRPQIQTMCPETDPENKSENHAFFCDFGSQNGAQMGPKPHPKSAKKQVRKQRGPGVQGGGPRRSTGVGRRQWRRPGGEGEGGR